MKRAVFFVVACLTATAATAANLPISGTYGDTAGCTVLQQGEGQQSEWMLVSPKMVSGHEWECTARQVRGTKITLHCNEAGDNGKGRIVKVSMVENVTAGTLLYTDPNGTLTLTRCKA